MAKKAGALTKVEREFSELDFHRRATWPRVWLGQAQDLRLAARLLWHAHEQEFEKVTSAGRAETLGLGEIALMLMGFALEVLFKGILVARDPSLAGEGRLNGSLKSHDLIALREAVGLDLPAHEAQLLERLSEAAIWMGRYPVPVRSQDLIYAKTGARHHFVYSTHDWRYSDDVFTKAEQVLRSLDREKWPDHPLESTSDTGGTSAGRSEPPAE